MRCQRRLWLGLAGVLAASAGLRADPGDAENSHDYSAFPRLPGFVISDFDEDNPAAADFLMARPLAEDSGHVEAARARGHRFVIRYEWLGPGILPSIYKAQQAYEKMATDEGFKIEKTGATGSVSETFHRVTTDGHDVWVRLDPSGFYNVVTVVEVGAAPSAPAPARLSSTPAAPATLSVPAVVKSVAPSALAPTPQPTPPPETPAPAPSVAAVTPAPTPMPAPSPEPAPTPAPAPAQAPESVPASLPNPSAPSNDEPLYDTLTQDGRVVVPFSFRPASDKLTESSKELVDEVATMMKKHPEIFLRIEGHTDNNGDADANMRLSADRAFAVQKALVNADVDKKRLDAVGVGGLQPVADNATAVGREKNRRIELVLWKKLPATHAPAPNGANYYPNNGAAPGA